MDSAQNIKYIKEWMSKEPHLPSDFDDEVIAKFLHSCYGNFEKTKKCIDRFCCTRAQMPDLFTVRDPFSTKMKTAFSTMVRCTSVCGEAELIINRFIDPTLEKFSFYDLLKALGMTIDYWIQFHHFKAEKHIIIIDLEHYSLKMISKINPLVLKDFILYMLLALPVRVTDIIAINSPSFYDKLYAIVKPMLPSAICDIIHFYPDHEGLYKYVDRKKLPVEYGGEEKSILKHDEEWYEKLDRERPMQQQIATDTKTYCYLFHIKYVSMETVVAVLLNSNGDTIFSLITKPKMFLNENLWKADLKKKRKTNTKEDNDIMNGSFKTLSID